MLAPCGDGQGRNKAALHVLIKLFLSSAHPVRILASFASGGSCLHGWHLQAQDFMSLCLLQELRKGKYSKANSSDEEVLQTIVELGLQVEGAASHAGVVLLPPKTVEQLLVDKRRPDLLQPFRLAMLKLASQVGASGACGAAVSRLEQKTMTPQRHQH